MVRVAVIALVAACYSPAAFEDPCKIACTSAIGCPDGLACGADGWCTSGATCTDQPPPPDGAGQLCVASKFFSAPICVDGPLQRVELEDQQVINTDRDCTKTIAQDAGPDVCVIAGSSIIVPGDVTVEGTLPLVLLGIEAIFVHPVENGTNGILQALNAVGRGCPTDRDGPPLEGGMYAGGGAGGSFITVGGAGSPSAAAVGGPQPGPKIVPNGLRGGCNGGKGGTGADNEAGGGVGRAGGALHLLARDQITIHGHVRAVGLGGRAGPDDFAGGGGGGSGGMIRLEANHVFVGPRGAVVAEGGGGGGSARDNAGRDGQHGQNDGSPAIGGDDALGAESGGDGSPSTMVDRTGVNGGGGGGGAGQIEIESMITTLDPGAVVSPSAL